MQKQRIQFRRPEPDSVEINLIPLIDVLLVVLIFLVVSTTYNRYSQLKVVVPNAQAEKMEAPKKNELVVSVSSTGQYAINGEVVSAKDSTQLAQALRPFIASKEAETVLFINADAMAPHQTVIHVLESARKVGIQKVSYITRQ
jgi:biopolymer transport protein ExbD